jgi:putative redox protein
MPNEIRIQLRQTSASTSEATIRDHRLLIDRPSAKGGKDAGPMGGELFLASVAGCFMSNLLAAIKARNAAISGVHIDVAGLLVETPSRFESVDLNVTAEAADSKALAQVIEIADRGCIMMNTLRDKLDIRIRIGVAVGPS